VQPFRSEEVAVPRPRSAEVLSTTDVALATGPGDVRVEGVRTLGLSVPTEEPESDGTLSWSETGVLVVEVDAGGQTGLGYSYTQPTAAAAVVDQQLAPAVDGLAVAEHGRAWTAMARAVRNLGRRGVATSAIAAVDVALWDLRARLLGVPVADLLGTARDVVPVYGSGGFTSYTDDELAGQLSGWVRQGILQVKMKVGRDPTRDVRRVAVARGAIGARPRLFVDANGAYSRKQALVLAEAFAEGAAVTWFEEPVSSDDLDGLRLLRDRVPAGMEVAAGEYGYDLSYFRRMVEAGAVDVLQIDATRAGGYTGFVAAAAVAEAAGLEVSSHCAPALHASVDVAVRNVRHAEWFHDHVRIEGLLFDGAPEVRGGAMGPDRSRPGLGLELKRADAERFATGGAR
jgi:L-alanine-DL-glutamate epimerase-like enolase superfamily enzyme